MNGSTYLFLFIPLLFGFIHGLLFATLLLIRGIRDERPPDMLLASLIGAGCLLLLPTLLGFLDIHLLWNEWLFLPLDPGLLIGPLLFYFIQAQTNRSFKFKKGDTWHLAPFIVYAVYHIAVFVQGPDFTFRWMDRYDLPFIDPIYKVLTLVTMTAYLLASVRVYHRYRKWIEEEYASPERVRFPWITRFLWAVGIAILVTCVLRLSEAFAIDLDYVQAWWTSIVVTLCIYYISLAGLLSARPPEHAEDTNTKDTEADEHSISPFTEQELNTWLQELKAMMESRQVYLNPEISLGSVAKELKLPRKSVSAAINARYGTNFRRFVNEYRVAAFKKALSNGHAREMTLFGIALDCGFNSKATFNRVFKQIEGIAPTEYARTIKQEGTLT